jgi:hypothetical protein
MTARAMMVAGRFATFLLDPGTQNYVEVFEGGAAISGVSIVTDGDVYEEDTALQTSRATWLDAGGTAADYEVRCTVVSGILDIGDAEDVFHALTVDREFSITTEGFETDTAELTIDIRQISIPTDIITFTVNLSATSDP